MDATTDVPHAKWLFMAILLIFILIYALFSWERSADLEKEKNELKGAKCSENSQSYYPFPSEEGDSGPFHKLNKSIYSPSEEGGGKNDLMEILENKKKMGYDDDDTALFIPFGQMIDTKIENRSRYAYDKKFDTAAADNYRLNFQSFHTEGGSTIPKLHEGDLSHNTETKSLDMSTGSWESERPLDGRAQQLTVEKEDYKSWIYVFGNSHSNFSITSVNDEDLPDMVYKNVRESTFDMTEAIDSPEGSGIAAQYDPKSLLDELTELLVDGQQVAGEVGTPNTNDESKISDERCLNKNCDNAPPGPMSLISVHSEVRQPGEGTELDKSADGLIASSYELNHQDFVRDFPNPTTYLPFVFDLDVGNEEFVQPPNVTTCNRQTSMLEIQVSEKNRVASLEIGFKLEKMEITEWDNITFVQTTMNEIVNNLFINQNGMEDVSISCKLHNGESLWPAHADNWNVSSDKYVDATEVGVMVKQLHALTSKSFGNVAEIVSATNEGVEFEEVNAWRKDDVGTVDDIRTENKDVCTATDIEAENLLDPGAIMDGDIPDGSLGLLERDKDTCLDYNIEPIGLGTKEQTQPVDLMTFEIQERDHAEKCLLNLVAFRPLQYVFCLVASHAYPPLLEMNLSAFRFCLLALRLCYAASHPYLPPNLTVMQTYTDCFPPNLTVMQTYTDCFPPNLTVMQTHTDCFPPNLTVMQTHTDCFPPNLTVMQTHTDCFPPNLTVMQTYTGCFPPNLTVMQTHTDCFPPNLTVMQTHTICFPPNLTVMQTHTDCFPPNLTVMQTHTDCFPPNLTAMQTHTDCFLYDIAGFKTCADWFPPGSTDSLIYRQDEARPLEGCVRNVAGNNNAFILPHLMRDLGPVQILPVSNNSSRPCRVEERRGATCQQSRGQKKRHGRSRDNPDDHCVMDGPDHIISLDEERQAGRLTQHLARYFQEKKNRKSALPLQPKCGNSDNDVKGAHPRLSNIQTEDLKQRCMCVTPRCTNEREIVCLGCGHLDYCEPCFNTKQKSDPSVCPSGNCRAPYPEHQKVNLG